MAERRQWWLVSYDVREPKRWREVYRVLRGVGRRVQYSVFRARLSRRELEKLRWELERRMDPADALMIVGLCAHCAGKVVTRGEIEAEPWDVEPPRWQIIE
jgi:CRISPR-associated protein Cas2